MIEIETKYILRQKSLIFLSFLYSHKRQAFYKEQIYDLIWGYDYAGNTNNLSSFVCNLRKKIEPNICKSTYIITGWGLDIHLMINLLSEPDYQAE